MGTENVHSPAHSCWQAELGATPAPELVVGTPYLTISPQDGHSLTGDLVFQPIEPSVLFLLNDSKLKEVDLIFIGLSKGRGQ